MASVFSLESFHSLIGVDPVAPEVLAWICHETGNAMVFVPCGPVIFSGDGGCVV